MVIANSAALQPSYISSLTSLKTLASVGLQLNTVTWHSSMLVFVIFSCQYVG